MRAHVKAKLDVHLAGLMGRIAARKGEATFIRNRRKFLKEFRRSYRPTLRSVKDALRRHDLYFPLDDTIVMGALHIYVPGVGTIAALKDGAVLGINQGSAHVFHLPNRQE
jgi:hypothetical protein